MFVILISYIVSFLLLQLTMWLRICSFSLLFYYICTANVIDELRPNGLHSPRMYHMFTKQMSPRGDIDNLAYLTYLYGRIGTMFWIRNRLMEFRKRQDTKPEKVEVSPIVAKRPSPAKARRGYYQALSRRGGLHQYARAFIGR